MSLGEWVWRSALGYFAWMPTRPHTMPYVWFYGLWCGLLPLWGKNRKLVELWLRTVVPIRTGIGTMAVLVGSLVMVVNLRNYLGVV